ncbi:MBL fold metallo-hydrolase [Devosia algicola]|uniref:MBL fold metallo-hydrolase n=1 Tax=Devosia algicola TaxID=3026418 RepID=A0ABY7YK35_9HYPH|nr:MBL fold metallo-hydrolase [Devosia algicola]WDR01542.1 MBL fold metallo-hydrolase [Devosia algicola]
MTKRRHVIAGLSALPFASFAPFVSHTFAQSGEAMLEGDIIETDDGNLTIHPVDHASLLLGWKDQVIYADPVGGAERYANLPAPTAIVITHGHGDHFDVPTLEAIAAGGIPLITNQDVFEKLPDALKPNATGMANGDEGVLNGLSIAAISAFNTTPDRAKYHPPGVGNGYLLKFDNKIVYVAGDTEPTPHMLALENIDVAFLPMNLPYTMTVEQAGEAIKTFKPKITYPYHYGDSDLSILEGLVGDASEVRLRDWYPNKA